MRKWLIINLLILSIVPDSLKAQAAYSNKADVVNKEPIQKTDTIGNVSISGYVDAYYAKYTDSGGPGVFQKFPTASPRSNSLGLNTAQLTFQYTSDKIRGTAVFHFGDIPSSTWPTQYNNIMEAHVGVRLTKKLWLDAGFFRTYFGTEYLLPVENMTTSVAVNTYYEPYYLSGIKLNYDPTSKLEINFYLMNGYNIFTDNNNKKSVGMSLYYYINDKWGIGYTNYIGDDSPIGDSLSHVRVAQNLYFNYQHKKWKMQIGGDLYFQGNSTIAAPHATATMYNALITLQYHFVPKFAMVVRGELFQDPNGVVSNIIKDKAGRLTGYKDWGLTTGFELKPTNNSYIRLEGRYLQMADGQNIFYYNGGSRDYRLEMMVNVGVTFDLLNTVLTKKSNP